MALNLPSIDDLLQQVKRVVTRFPLTLFYVLVGTYLLFGLIDKEAFADDYIKFIMVCAVGLPLSLALALYAERKHAHKGIRLVYQIAGFLLLLTYYFSIGTYFDESEALQFSIFSITAHLMVAFAPFLVKNETNGFWQFNEILFVRILTAALYSTILWLGLSGALVAIDNLFDVNVNYKIYMKLWIFLAGIFNTLFFLAGVPDKVENLEQVNTYPKGLKVFTQFILLPLVAVYLSILYVYAFKIIAEWNLPKGWVSWLVIGFSVSGILSLLLIFPIRKNNENKWMILFSNWFFKALIPLLFLLFISIGYRISEYGITENRYYILSLTIWLFIISLFFIIKGFNQIKLIPVSLAIVFIVSTVGPLSARQTGIRSQFQRLVMLLENNSLISNGKLIEIANENTIEKKVKEDIISILRYLDDHKKLKLMQPFVDVSLDTLLMDTEYSYLSSEKGKKVNYEDLKYTNSYSKILKLMGIENEYFANSNELSDYRYIHLSVADSMPIKIEPTLSYLKEFDVYRSYSSLDETNETTKTKGFSFLLISDSDSLKLFKDGKIVSTLGLRSIVNKYSEFERTLPPDDLKVVLTSNEHNIVLYFKQIVGNFSNGKLEITSVNGIIMWNE